jgi:hypothetical protein
MVAGARPPRVDVDLWDATTRTHGATLGRGRKFVAAGTFSPPGRLLAVAGDAPVVIWEVGSARFPELCEEIKNE